MYELSVFMPTIRTHLHEAWFASLEKSCNRHKFEVVMCGPFEPPESILSRDNVTWIRSFSSPTVCAQIAAITCSGRVLFHSVDDTFFAPGLVSDELDRIKNCVVGMRYNEGGGYRGPELSKDSWLTKNWYDEWNGVDNSWQLCGLFLMERSLFLEFGGFDCVFEYLSNALTDLLFRIQSNDLNVNFILSKGVVCNVDHMPGTSGDHGPMHIANAHDVSTFNGFWYDKAFRNKIDINNYKQYPEIWNLRFRGTERKYGDLV